MLLDESKPALQLFDVLACGRDALLQHPVFSLEDADALPCVGQLRAAVMPLALAVGQLLLRLDVPLPPRANFLLERLEEVLQLSECRDVRPCVR